MKELDEIETTADVEIPTDPLDRVIGQDEAITLAKIAARQRRHLLLVGPPGTGKSMIAQALSLHLESPKEEIRVVHNPENPQRPQVEIKSMEEVLKEREGMESAEGELVDPKEVPLHIAEKLGYKCVNCGTYSSPQEMFCPRCGTPKASGTNTGETPFGDISDFLNIISNRPPRKRVTTTRKRLGKEEVVVFERAGEMIKVLDQKALEKRRELEKVSPRKVIVPLERSPFVLATGASETELLGDVRHDPYGGHQQLGTQPYERVVAGSIHEAHEGVLFIDEIPHLGKLQRFILTAMQEKKFPISGRNPQSAGASVRVDAVPCDFIFVGACNIQDLEHILSPLRSRINGSGYEVLMESTMPDTEENRARMLQFVAQEIQKDGRIPHATKGAVMKIIEIAGKRAKTIDNADNALTLRLRELGGLIRAAGDLAVWNGDPLIEEKHIEMGLKRSRSAESQIVERYGTYQRGVSKDISQAQREQSPYYYWDENRQGDEPGYM